MTIIVVAVVVVVVVVIIIIIIIIIIINSIVSARAHFGLTLEWLFSSSAIAIEYMRQAVWNTALSARLIHLNDSKT
jgi:hypothetical protein